MNHHSLYHGTRFSFKCRDKILGKSSLTLFAKIFVTFKTINMFWFGKLIINTVTILNLHQTTTNPHPQANMQGVIGVISTMRTVCTYPLYRAVLTSQHIVIQLYFMHLKFLSEYPSCLPCPHLILHPQEVLDQQTPQLQNLGWPTTLSWTSGLRTLPLQS